MQFKRVKSALVPGTTYSGTIYNVSVINPDTKEERVLININSTAGLPGPASYATASEVGSRMLNQLLDSLNCEDLDNLVNKEINFRVKPNEAGYLNTVIYPKSVVSAETVEVKEELAK